MAFDVFISYKNTDDKGARTRDFYMAEELYRALKESGIEAFFSSRSIVEKGEHRFGRMIREAIEQCSIFVAVGTRIEHFESEWMEYERESFHGEMLNGHKARAKSAMFSYITRDVPVDRLPMELRRCQVSYDLKELVASICKRLKSEDDVIRNFNRHFSEDMFSKGSLIGERYEVLNKIGQGGMSAVYLVLDLRLNKPWAIKAIQKDRVGNLGRDFELKKQSLIYEFDLLRSFDHPDLPKIADVIDTDDSFIIVMDYIEGSPLETVMNQKGAQDESLVIEWAKQLCDILNYLHTRNPAVIYRDIKPANIMLRPNGRLTLVDFGIAREYKQESVGDTVCLGTMGYAAPEQFGGMGQTDQRTDIYALGVTLGYLVTGRNPTQAGDEKWQLRRLNPELSHGFEYIINKCMQLDPERRYQSAAELMRDLDNIERLNTRYRRRNAAARLYAMLFGKKEKSAEPAIAAEKKRVESEGGEQGAARTDAPKEFLKKLPPVSVVRQSDIANENTLGFDEKVVLCVGTGKEPAAGSRLNVYFATRSNREDITKLIASNTENERVVTSEEVFDVDRESRIRLSLHSPEVVFDCDEVEFLWDEHIRKKFYEYFSFQIVEMAASDELKSVLTLYVNGEHAVEMNLEY
ncbi:MAG: protein kinase [Oscillospiraceae bacterium]|nr:protein kinase [Oscillospiraceae bacterium]